MKHNPCYKCSEREIGCHDKCKEYAAWQAENERHREQTKEEIQSLNAIIYNGRRQY